jgi:hypothetical protein
MTTEIGAEAIRAKVRAPSWLSERASHATANRRGRDRSVVTSAARVALLAVVLGVVLLRAPCASAYERPPLLETVASHFAMRPADVRCPSTAEWQADPIWSSRARRSKLLVPSSVNRK